MTQPTRMIALLALILAAPGEGALAYRPFDGTDADVADRGEVELELGPVGYLHEGDRDFVIAPDAILNFGLTKRWEVVLEGQHRIRSDQRSGEARHQLTDTAAFLKGVLREGDLQGRPGPSIALEFGALLPTIHDESGVGAAVLLAASRRWNAVTLHVTGEIALERSGDITRFGGLILEGPERWRVRPVIELFVEGDAGDSFPVRSALVGAIWEASDMLSFDCGVRVARSEGETDYELRAGLTWTLKGDGNDR